jgi:hypothetical protein
MADCYDPNGDRVLGDNVWVFRPNGTFDAVMHTGGQELILTGTYSTRKGEDGLLIDLGTDGDGEFGGKFDEGLYVGYNSLYIEWQYENEWLGFYLVGDY